jgi:putative flavoprotein involved in K+ transport
VLERYRVAQAWRGRWDSFTLVTPNWTLSLPGSKYERDDPEGHVDRDIIIEFLQDYADHHAGPVREGVSVDALEPGASRRFRLATSDGDLEADAVVVCTGAYQRPHLLVIASAFPAGVAVLDATATTDPATYRMAASCWSAPGRRGCSWPKNFTWPAATSCWPAGARRGAAPAGRAGCRDLA